jgi:hypothetical protein
VYISYRFPAFPAGTSRRPWILLTAVDSVGDRYPPFQARTRIRRRTGLVVQRVGPGRAPYRLHVAVWARDGARSRTISILLK